MNLGVPGNATVPCYIIYLALSRLGLVLLVVGAMHFFNICNFHRLRRKAAAHA